MPTDPVGLHLIIGWASMIGGAVSGAAIGLFFHLDAWMGGYGSFRRRLVRLGHIAMFGLGILNVLFALSVSARPLPPAYVPFASAGFAAAVVTMPLCCFLTAWRPSFRHLFPVPVVSLLLGLGALVAGWARA
jgi:hypothetical protein